MENEEIEITLDTKKIYNFFKKNQRLIIYASLAVIIVLAFFSRTQNIHFLDHKYLLSPDDPYYFYRMAMDVAKTGHVPANDTMRYWPIGALSDKENLGTAYLAGYLYRALHSIGWNGNMFDLAAYYAPVLLMIGLIPFFFLVRELFDEKTAIIATGILAFSGGILFRTMAGFLEKEPLFWPLFITSTLFIVLSIKRKRWYFATIAGFFAALSGFASGLFQYFVFIYGLFFTLEILLETMDKNKAMNLAIFTIVLGISLPFFTDKYGDHLTIWKSMFMLILYFTELMALVYLFIKNKVKLPEKIPTGITAIVIGILISIGAGYLFLGSERMGHMISFMLLKLSNPMAQPIFGTSVSENQPPTFFGARSWWGTFNFAIIFFYIGAVLLFHKIFKTKSEKARKVVTATFAIFLLALLMDHFTGNPNSAIDLIFKPQILYWSIFVAGVIYFVWKVKKHEHNEAQMFLIAWLIFSIIMAHGAIRLFFMLAFPLSILSGYFFTWLAKKYSEKKWVVAVSYGIAAIYILLLINTAFAMSSVMNPGLQDWYTAMYWIANNTPKDSVFTHWWDYGYLVQAIGQRPTVVDPGNWYVKRNFDTGGHLFAAHSLSEVAWYGKKYDYPNYWLICSEDVLKYYQISRLGSLAENASGRTAYLSVYSIVNPEESIVRNILHTKGQYLYVLQPITGYQLTFEDFEYQGYLFDGNDTFVVAIMVPFDKNGTNLTTYWPWAQVYDKYHNTATLPVKCVCYQNMGCMISNETDTVPICVEPMKGGDLVMPEKVKDTLFAKLYLFNLTVPGFKLVYDGPEPLNAYTILGHGTNVKIYQFNWSEIEAEAK